MSLEKRLQDMPEGIESQDVKELRQVILRLQKQLKQSKERSEDLVEATHRGAYDAMIALGAVPPVSAPKKDTRKINP